MQQVLLVICCFFALGSAFRNESESLRCGVHEVPACVQKCPPERTCRNRYIAFRCAYDPDPCTKKCICAEGYYRNAIGECITKAQCEQCDAPNEFYSCNSACDNECDKIDTQNRTNCPIKNIVCNKWCYCDDGYARDSERNCVPVNECKPKLQPIECDENEVPGHVCKCPPEKTCKNRGRVYRCNPEGNTCTDKCECADGYYRNAIGQCISEAQCEQCDVHSNEFFACDSACDNVCDTIDTQNRTKCPIKNKKCSDRCYCEDGYARDGDGKCVPVSECKPKCGENEIFTCKKSCPPELCFSIVARFKCDSKEVCKERCACKPGYLREKEGSPCVALCDCPEMENSSDCEEDCYD